MHIHEIDAALHFVFHFAGTSYTEVGWGTVDQRLLRIGGFTIACFASG